ncbi:ABC transporter ATP-binding protein [Candidatus Xianfuyuplasma coldseepsis]|uniref:ABC transporter ATP-binding protein n=1 Tax=Candidatus Xianfuyuplasma coldseepsis TaxID=2782163 RepID=A0A7L7KUK1_9MOLU|nr:ABC transporter ATP-binding protein [Xianfuyuplasma coldseepsis]QMS85962.1 ABC transporter ATP-binding protein [Xianfuyuplasma coldseepsis]
MNNNVDHSRVVLDKRAIKLRNQQNKDYSKDLNKVVGGGPRRMYLGKNASDRKGTILRLWSYLEGYHGGIIVILVANIVSSLLNLVIPYLFALALNDYIKTFDFSGAYRLAGLIIVVSMANSLIRMVGRYVTLVISQETVSRIRKEAFDKLQVLPVKYYDTNQPGDIVSRITNDVDLISNVLAAFINQFVQSVIMLVGSLIMMFVLNWALALVVIAFVPIILVLTKRIAKISRSGFIAQQKHLGNLNSIVEESIAGLKVIKLYGREEEIKDDFIDSNIKLRNAGYKAQVVSGFLMPIVGFITNLTYVAVIGFGTWFIIIGFAGVSILDIAAITQYARQFSQPISNLAQLFNTIQQGIAGAERVFNVIDEASEYENDGSIEIEDLHGHVEFDGVHFAYEEGKEVLTNISFEATIGKTIAIVGPTGSGKTTIINLLNRFYDIEQGTIRIDDVDIKEYKKDHLRKHIGVVLQDTSLFTGSVYDNIVYGRIDATKDDVEAAAKMANAHDFIMKLPHGYETEVTEGGNNFSQGERQLISIARTILSNPDILILDEATSNVDTRTEFKIQESMHRLMQGRTSFVIAHRLQTIRNADKILVIKDGQLIEQGDHHSLLQDRGFYYDLYTTQFKDLVLEEGV